MGAGPRIHIDGLALGFDTGRTTVDDNTFNYSNFLGEPTVNYTTDTPSQGGWTGTYNVLDSSRKKFRFNVSNFNGAAGSGQGWRSFTWDLRAYTGQSVTISATIEIPDLSPGTFAWVMMGQGNTHTNSSGAGGYMGYSAASERIQKSTLTKEHITWSGTLGNSGTASQPSGHVGFTVWYNNGVPGVNSFIEVSDVQIELKSHETPFINGTRGNTNNLKDLSNNCVIDITNTSYGTASNIELDGTDDIISVTGFTQPSDPNVFTAEAIVKVHSHNSNTNIGQVIINNYSNYNGWIFFLNGTTSKLGIRHHLGTNQSMPYNLVYGTGLSLNEWYHVAATDDGTTVRLYLNGTQVASQASGTATNFSGQPKLGGWSAGSGLDIDGEQPVTRVYNKTLTASEINSNYEAYKNRFNLS